MIYFNSQYLLKPNKEEDGINKAGIKIRNIKAGTLYGFNLGVRDHYDYTDGILSNSLFSDFLKQNGLKIYKDGTRDLICLDFDFGSRSYEEEVAHLESMLHKAQRERMSNPIKETREHESDGEKKIHNLLEKVYENRYKYKKATKDEIREHFYQNGVSITYKIRRRGNVEHSETIHYQMLYRNSSKAKLGQVMFINSKLYIAAYKWMTMGLGNKMPTENAKIVEMSAYAPLTTSTIIDKIHIPVEDVLILKDQDSIFNILAKVVKAEEYDGYDRFVDEDKTKRNKDKAIKTGKLDLYGDPIYKTAYKKDKVKKKKCIVVEERIDVKNTLWDGMGLIEKSYFPDYINGMALLRNHFFKMCGFMSNIHQFFRDWCDSTGNDYETYEITDMFGVPHKMKDIKVITTDNAIKWKKFMDLMGKNETAAYLYWCKCVNADGSDFGLVKTDHPSKLGDVQQMSYQMINTLPCTFEDVGKLAKTSIEYVKLLKNDNDEFERFLRKNKNIMNHYEMMADLYQHNKKFAESKWFRTEKRKIISQYVYKLRGGKITVNADNLTICGNPYALLLYSVGEDFTRDPTLNYEEGTIQCYTSRFSDGEHLCAIRNPHNSPNNICYLHNTYSPEMEKYFPFSENILAINCIHSDIQDRANGCDEDSDFFFVSNNSVLVKYAKVCYEEFPTIANRLNESGITYENTMLAYAQMDSKLALSKKGIGASSNLAMLALTYYLTNKSQELYDNFVILAVLAQVVIDSCKREYEVDALSEIDRIKSLPCMTLTKTIIENGKEKQVKCDMPVFMKYTKSIKVTSNGRELPFESIKVQKDKLLSRINPDLVCPMNWLQNWLDKIQGAGRHKSIPTEEFFIKIPGKANSVQMSKIRKLVEEYDAFIRLNMAQVNDDSISEIYERTEKLYETLRKIKIGNIVTINRLIETALGLEKLNNNPNCNSHNDTKYTRKLMNVLYNYDSEKFLSNFYES